MKRRNKYVLNLKNFLLNNLTEKRRRPYSAQIEITLRCMANCRFCCIPSIPDTFKQKEMSTSQIKQIIDQVSDLGVLSLSFTGGEPSLREDLPELIRYSGIEKRLITGLATNGYNIPYLLNHKLLKGLNYILLSLDYPNAHLHDKMRGITVFDKVIQSISLAEKQNINVIISTNVMKSNIKMLPEICQLAQKFGCSIELYPCENIIRSYNGRHFQAENASKLIPDLQLWAKIVKGLQKKYNNVITDQYSVQVIESGGFGGVPKHQSIMRCHVAEAYLFIRHDGTISFPCKLHPLVSYNVLSHSLQSIYNSPQVIDMMRSHDDFEFCDGCRLGCAITSSLTAKWPTFYEKYVRNVLRGNL